MFYCGNRILRPVLGYLPDLQEKRTGGVFPGRNSAVLHSYPDSSAFYVDRQEAAGTCFVCQRNG